MKYLLALRPVNLIIVALTFYIFGYWILYPVLLEDYIPYKLRFDLFALFTVSAMCITGTGNLINDYFDFEGDKLSKKTKQFQSKKSLLRYYFLVNGIGFCLALYVAITIEKPIWILLYPCTSFLLYSYSYKLKAQGLIGNLFVALFCAGILGVLYFAEHEAIYSLNDAKQSRIKMIFLAFGIFAFLSNIYREIVKDLEDYEEDKAMGLHTLPIKMGIDRTKILAAFFGLFLMLLLGLWAIKSYQVYSYIHPIYIFALLIIPLWLSLRRLMRSNDSESFHHVSQLIKIVMLTGLFYVLLL